jgi:hypothetical protein
MHIKITTTPKEYLWQNHSLDQKKQGRCKHRALYNPKKPNENNLHMNALFRESDRLLIASF